MTSALSPHVNAQCLSIPVSASSFCAVSELVERLCTFGMSPLQAVSKNGAELLPAAVCYHHSWVLSSTAHLEKMSMGT